MEIKKKNILIGLAFIAVFIVGVVFGDMFGLPLRGQSLESKAMEPGGDNPRPKGKIGGSFNQCPSGFNFVGIVWGDSNPYGVSYMVCANGDNVQIVVL